MTGSSGRMSHDWFFSLGASCLWEGSCLGHRCVCLWACTSSSHGPVEAETVLLFYLPQGKAVIASH